MTTWSLEQIRAVRSLRLRIAIVNDLLRVARIEVLAAAQHRVAGQLADAAHSYAVELAPVDVVLIEDSSVVEMDRFGIRHFLGVWHPAVKEVELRGGEKDGQIFTVENVWEPFNVARIRPWSWAAEADAADTVTYERDVYRMAGWREQERRWVFALE
ncbi:MAG TPA: hypothetical protein VMV41_03400 [Cellulomonadaceae bacterium]|nr:hypothetical protein [Cellulomonadaceae bacterium]